MPKLLTVAISLCLLSAVSSAGARNDDELNRGGTNWPIFRGDTLADGVARSKLPNRPQLLWKHTVPGGAFEGTPAIVDGVVYIGDLDGTLFALRLKDGSEIWKYTIDGGFPASPAVRDSRVYIGDYDGGFHCIDAKTGEKQWFFETNAEISSCANFFQNTVLVGSQDATLYCLNALSGEVAWQLMLQDQIRCSPTIVDGRAFVAGCDGQLHIVNVEKGEAIASVPINSPHWSDSSGARRFRLFRNGGR